MLAIRAKIRRTLADPALLDRCSTNGAGSRLTGVYLQRLLEITRLTRAIDEIPQRCATLANRFT